MKKLVRLSFWFVPLTVILLHVLLMVCVGQIFVEVGDKEATSRLGTGVLMGILFLPLITRAVMTGVSEPFFYRKLRNVYKEIRDW